MIRCTARQEGYTLIELLIALVIGAALLSLAGSLLARTIASNSAANDHLSGVVALGALGQQFRRDVHATLSATTAEVDGHPRSLTLDLVDGTRTEYEIFGGGLKRTQKSNGRAIRRESFNLQGMKVLDFKASIAEDAEVSIIIGRLTQRPGDENAVSGQFEITAVVLNNKPTEGKP